MCFERVYERSIKVDQNCKMIVYYDIDPRNAIMAKQNPKQEKPSCAINFDNLLVCRIVTTIIIVVVVAILCKQVLQFFRVQPLLLEVVQLYLPFHWGHSNNT